MLQRIGKNPSDAKGRGAQCRLGVWVAPPFEILVDDVFDGRVLWHSRYKDECALRIVFRSDDSNSLRKCSAEVRNQGSLIATTTNVSPVLPDPRSEFWERTCTLLLPLLSTDADSTEDKSRDLRLSIDQLIESRSLVVMSRKNNLCVPSSVFFRTGVPSQKVLVLKSHKPIALQKCESLDLKLEIKWESISPNLQKVFVGYDGYELPLGRHFIRLHISELDATEVVDVPVYFVKSSVGSVQAEE